MRTLDECMYYIGMTDALFRSRLKEPFEGEQYMGFKFSPDKQAEITIDESTSLKYEFRKERSLPSSDPMGDNYFNNIKVMLVHNDQVLRELDIYKGYTGMWNYSINKTYYGPYNIHLEIGEDVESLGLKHGYILQKSLNGFFTGMPYAYWTFREKTEKIPNKVQRSVISFAKKLLSDNKQAIIEEAAQKK